MKRRDFFTTAALATGAALATADDATPADPREYIGVKTFYTPDAEAQARLVALIDERLIPVRRELGFSKTGVFTVNHALHEGDGKFDAKFAHAVFVVGTAPCFGAFERLHERIQAQLPTERRLQTFVAEANYVEQENALLRAFPTIPKLEVPTLSADRVVQYRCYFSPSPDRNRQKLRMFDERGELALFRACGMAPVFFGETLFGTTMPNISYMLSFENDAARVAGWKKFVTSDEWKQMRDEPAFKDTATRVRNLFLKPSPGSEI